MVQALVDREPGRAERNDRDDREDRGLHASKPAAASSRPRERTRSRGREY